MEARIVLFSPGKNKKKVDQFLHLSIYLNYLTYVKTYCIHKTLAMINTKPKGKTMKMHSIEIDDEIFEYLKAKAEPFVDTPNSVLRRELLMKKDAYPPSKGIHTATSYSTSPSIPLGTPKALEQILEVAYLVRQGKTRLVATHFIAKKHGVAFQTVLDKYTRQLGLTTSQFDALYDQEDLRDLKSHLRRKFPDHSVLIDSYL